MGGVGGGDVDHDDNVVVRGDVGGGVHRVSLARTGFDAWVLALIGGLSVAGGLGLLAAQRRGKLHGSTVSGGGGGVGAGHVHDDDVGVADDDDVVVRGGGVGAGKVQRVTLARTGFDAWVLALIGGVALAGGLGLLAAQRRGRLSA